MENMDSSKPVERILAVVDWFRFTCLWELDVDHIHLQDRLWDILKVSPSEMTWMKMPVLGKEGYCDGLVLDEGINIGLDPRPNAIVHGVAAQFMVDMPATACHQFEDRGGSWLELFQYLLAQPVRINRVDTALDDIDGVLDASLLKDKITKGEFVCPFRAAREGGKRGDEMYDVGVPEDDPIEGTPHVLDTRLGYTATFGNHGSTQELQFYDKSAERQAHGLGVLCNSWVRAEARFGHPRAGWVVEKVLVPALSAGTFGHAVAGLIHGLIEFKSSPSSSTFEKMRKQYNVKKLPIWNAWDHVLQGADAVKVPSLQNKVEASVTRSLQWIDSSWARSTFTRLFGISSDPSVFGGIFQEYVDHHLRKKGVSWEEIAQVKNWFLSNKKPVPTTDKVLDDIQTVIDTFYQGSEPFDVKADFYHRQEEYQKSRHSNRDKFVASFMGGLSPDGVPLEDPISGETAFDLEGIDGDGSGGQDPDRKKGD